MTTPLNPQTSQPTSWRRKVAAFAPLVIAPLLALGLTAFVFQTVQVSGESMQNTLQNNDRLLIWKGAKSWDRLLGKQYVPSRGDIVIVAGNNFSGCEAPSGSIVKRVIGLPGDRVTYHSGRYKVYNSAHPAGFDPDTSLPYGSSGTPELTDTQAVDVDVTLSSSQLFVSGDHRNVSCDSRTFGPIQSKQVVGKLLARILPISQAERF